MTSILLPIHEIAKVSSIKLPIRENALVLNGFVMRENIVTLLEQSITFIESIKSNISLYAELVDKNHVKISWVGETVPKILVYETLEGEDFSNTPIKTVNWNPQECLILIDSNGHQIKVKGLNDTGESNVISIGENKEYGIDCSVDLPLNEKNHFIAIELISEYRIGVNL